MEGACTFDNCYMVVQSVKCNSESVSNLELWHEKFGHIHYKTIRGILKLSNTIPKVCGKYLNGKQ